MIHWGIIGAGNIANRFVQAMVHQKDSVLEAVACRTMEKATLFANTYNSKKAYDDFQAVIDDKEVDVIYIAVPHIHHYEWCIKALENKKAVLVEKPAVLDVEQMKHIKDTAIKNNTFFMEAMKSKCVPAFKHVKKLVENGEIGTINKVTTSFCNVSPYKEGAYHYQANQGGALYDLGVYNTAYLTEFLKGDYKISCIDTHLFENGIDVYCNALMHYENGAIGILETAFDIKKENYASLQGVHGEIRISPLHRPTNIEIIKDGATTKIVKEYEHDDFYSEINEVCECLNNRKIESSIISFDDSIKMVEMIQRCKQYINKKHD